MGGWWSCAAFEFALEVGEEMEGFAGGEAVDIGLLDAVDDALGERCEHGHLDAGGARGGSGFADLLGLGALVELEDVAGAGDDGGRKTGEAGDFDAVALAGRAGFDGVEEDDAGGGFANSDAEVAEVREAVGEEGEFVVVGGEEGARADGVVEVLDGGPGEGEAVVGGGASAHFVEQDEGAGGGGVENGGGFGHLDHKSRPAAGYVVGRADAGIDAVDEAEGHALGGDEAAALGHDGEQRSLAEIGGFATHVGAGDEEE